MFDAVVWMLPARKLRPVMTSFAFSGGRQSSKPNVLKLSIAVSACIALSRILMQLHRGADIPDVHVPST